MILEEIRQRYAEFTRSQKRIADLISTSYHQVAFMTATQIADQLLINEATVIRFAQRLGYRGYPTLADAIREVVQEELAARPSTAQDGDLKASLRDASQYLDRIVATLPDDLGERLVAAIESATHIYVLAEGMATHLAGLLAHGLRRLGLSCTYISSDASLVAEALSDIGSDDLVIGLCVEEGGDLTAKALQIVRGAGCATLGLTLYPTSPVARAAEVSCSCPHGARSDLPTVTGLAALIDALLQSLVPRRAESLRARSEQITTIENQLRSQR